MARNAIKGSSINLDVIYDTLGLDDASLLDKVALVLHQQFGSICTCIVEFNQIGTRLKTLSYACENQLQPPQEHSIEESTLFKIIRKTGKNHVVYKNGVKDTFSSPSFFKDKGVEAFIGIPLRTSNGEVLGVLQSSFAHTLDDTDELVYFHNLFARLVVHYLREKWFADKSQMLVSQLSFEVSHDSLTGLFNRDCLSNKLDTLTTEGRHSFTLAYIDIDNFKSINDIYGNHIGDQVIKFVANAVQDAITESQLAFRIAGDEFAFISLSEDPFEICNRIIDKIEPGYRDFAHTIKVKVSIGLASNSAQHLTSDEIILNASLALKECKRSRNHDIQCYDTHLSVQYYRRSMVIEALRKELTKDIEESNVYIVVQPIVGRNSQQWDRFEVLARWHSKRLGDVSPLEFISAAEQSGLIIELGERILKLACQAKQLLDQGLGYPVKLSINCSACEIQNSTRYLSNLINTIESHQFKPSDFIIELTETVLLSKTNEVRKTLDDLRVLGFSIALDDFGTGYSSLNYIHSYPIDYIKVDAAFIRNMVSNKASERIVWLIIQLAKQLNVELIAEGVETKQALDKLYSMGCEHIQGYYFSRPHTPYDMVNLYKLNVESDSKVSHG
ncbi:putative bifunctional diguanylate cyclase/phosphodiesterase [Vibrio japonicus]|uniref:EAL domain-containing protein n=1 Tax=Vibrio japonicus TaxID=1824638 RepID=A0ABY5LQB7_9VIBR|nr:GGDEF domain-containing phosphodiesterase [Vibrio japonicus]UUM32962.1 EAL domain-containing protein [Vibrio japonicus]